MTSSPAAANEKEQDPRCAPGQAGVIYGTDSNDVLYGTEGDDVICGLHGDDVLYGFGGNDLLIGGTGNDFLDGGQGNDTLDSGDGDDFVFGGPGDDAVPASGGDDSIHGEDGNDVLDGGEQNDYIVGGPGDDTLVGQKGEDFLDGGADTDSLDGGVGEDVCLDGETLVGCEATIDPRGVDTDGDGLVDGMEPAFGGDPNLADTDGDGLTDGFEARWGGAAHHVDDPDTDADGVGDASEDVDGDGLTAAQEQAAGSDPLVADTDRDGVADGDELAQGTNPTLNDSDDDGLDDGAEHVVGTDPLDPDSDDDGILDGDEPYTTTATGPDGVEVALTGTGNLAASVEITSLATEPVYSGALGQVGQPYDISLSSVAADALAQAEITLPYDPAAAGNEADLRVFTLHPEAGMWVPAAPDASQTVDAAAHAVTATVTHFSIFAVFNIANWQAEWTAVNQACLAEPGEGGNGEPIFIDIVFALDSSGSMISNDPNGLRKEASKNFVDALLSDDRAGVVDFDGGAVILSYLTSDFVAVKAAIDQINSSGGTNIGAGVDAGLDVFDAAGPDPDRGRVMILLTDGFGSYDSSLTTRAANSLVTIYTIGLGSSVDANLLTQIAEGTGGEYFAVANADELPEVIRDIGGDVTDDRDTDGDGLTDCEEVRGMPDFAGNEFFSNPQVADTDGDELPDGVEIEKIYHDEVELFGVTLADILGTEYSYVVYSDPQAENTDLDPDNPIKPTDTDEFAFGTNARRIDSDGDGLDDSSELIEGLDPLSTDTDGDGLGDFEELVNLQEPDGDFDPRVFDETRNVDEWMRLYEKGFRCGELLQFCLFIEVTEEEAETVPYFIGSIASAFGGPIADVRDIIGGVVNRDLLSTGLSFVGLVPVGGDFIKGLAKVRDVAKRVPGRTLALLVRATYKLPLDAGLRRGIVEILVGDGMRILRGAGLTDEGLDILIRGTSNLPGLARGAALARRVGRETLQATWQGGQTILRNRPGYLPTGRGLADPAAASGRRNWRIVDAFNPGPPRVVGDESKVGRTWDLDGLFNQMDHDRALLDAGSVGGGLDDATWHFFPSGASQRLQDDPEVFERLLELEIPFEIYLPVP